MNFLRENFDHENISANIGSTGDGMLLVILQELAYLYLILRTSMQIYSK
jgi:hypothetical protein